MDDDLFDGLIDYLATEYGIVHRPSGDANKRMIHDVEIARSLSGKRENVIALVGDSVAEALPHGSKVCGTPEMISIQRGGKRREPVFRLSMTIDYQIETPAMCS